MNGKSNGQPESKIPVFSPSPLRRSGSARLNGCPPIQEYTGRNYKPNLHRHRSLQSLSTTSSSFVHEQEDDADSVKSFSSTASVCSNVSQCDHANFARNGTTYSGRCKRYVVHCSPHSTESDDYLTPTQRTNRSIRKLRSLLKDAQEEIREKDKEIFRLTKEVVELRLLKVTESSDIDGDTGINHSQGNLTQSDNQSACTDPLTTTLQPQNCSSPPPVHSLSDSGHYEDLNSSKEACYAAHTCSNKIKTPESFQRQYEDEIRELKEKHNDKVDSLLQRITDVNDRYYALRPLYEDCKEKCSELEKINEELKTGCRSHCMKLNELEAANENLFQDKKTLEIEISDLKQVKEEIKTGCQSLYLKLNELEATNENLLRDNQTLEKEIKDLKQVYEELKLNKLYHDKLEIENKQLRLTEDELMKALNNLKERCKTCYKINPSVSDESIQTEYIQLEHLCNGCSEETQLSDGSCNQNNHCSNKIENPQIKFQIVTPNNKIQQLEDGERSKTDNNMHLENKDIQLELSHSKGTENGQNEEKESSLVPVLLQKLTIKQEELDNLKAMYRRLLESRKEQPKHDPEMTLQFLKSAFYYFLTDRENAPGHLSAIESILGFTDNEKINIEKAFLWR